MNMNQGRKISGGKYHRQRKRRLHASDSQERHVVIGETKRKQERVNGGNIKIFILKANWANVIVNGKAKKAEIKNVKETPQNKFYARENRLMKGVIIETSLGEARVTSRPSQEGVVNAVLVKPISK